MPEDVPGIRIPSVTKWFEDNIPGVKAPLHFDLIAGGHSNLTFKVTDTAGSAYILRRPPLRHLLPTAHDVRREYRAMMALAGTAVPVPPLAGFCSDSQVTDAVFYVMKFVPGTVLHDRETAERFLDEKGRRTAAESLIDILVELHAIDPDSVGLGDLGRKEDYVVRQIRRWYRQFELSKTRELPIIEDLRDKLLARIPEQGLATIVHGDFRLGNSICRHDGQIVAVLDWEVCTLGDPLADISYVIAMWPHPTDPFPPTVGPTMAPGFPSQRELLESYAAKSGRDVSRINFYRAFHFWRMACINEEVHARYLNGAYGEPQVVPDIRDSVEVFAQSASDVLQQLP